MFTQFDAKSYYQNKTVALRYDETRFKTIKGRLFKFLRSRRLERVHQEFPMGHTTLDIACGTGLISEWFFRKGHSVTAGDSSIQMLKVVRRKLNHSASLVQFNAQFLPFRDKSFDSVTSFRFLNLVPPQIRLPIHQEIARVSRGYALLSYAKASRYQRWRGTIKRLLGLSSDEGFPLTPEALERELKAAGMKSVKQMMVNRFLSSELIVLVEVIR
jgi:SAM-dependent methyltransferase